MLRNREQVLKDECVLSESGRQKVVPLRASWCSLCVL